MASSNALIVEVVGDTKKLSASLKAAEAEMKGFSSRTSTIRSTGADKFLADTRRMQTESEALGQELKAAGARADEANTSLRRVGAGSLIAGVAINTLGRNLSETGGEGKRFGAALSALSTGNFVGFYHAARDNTEALSAFSKELLAAGDIAKASEKANLMAAAGFDEVAEAARKAAGAIALAQNAFADPTRIRDSTSPGAIAAETSGVPLPRGRRGVTRGQRNQWFDTRIARKLDRAQDLALQAQVKEVQRIKAEVQAQLAKTKDPTRRLRLKDEIAHLDRQIKGLNQEIADGIADAAQKMKDARLKLAQRFKDEASAIKAAVLDALDLKQSKLDTGRALTDAKEALRIARQEGGPKGIRQALRDVQDAQLDIERLKASQKNFAVTQGPAGPRDRLQVGSVTITINSNQDPKEIARQVLVELRKADNRGSAQSRGTIAGRNFNVGIH